MECVKCPNRRTFSHRRSGCDDSVRICQRLNDQQQLTGHCHFCTGVGEGIGVHIASFCVHMSSQHPRSFRRENFRVTSKPRPELRSND